MLSSLSGHTMVNTQDIKTVTICPAQETAIVATSQESKSISYMTRHRLERFTKELGERYNVLRLPSGNIKSRDKANTVLLIEQNDTRVYIWPKALFSILKTGNDLIVTAFGMTVKVDRCEHISKEDLIDAYTGLIEIRGT